PNPFTSSTVITFKTAGGHTLIQVLDASGRVVANLTDKDYPAGTYTIAFDSGFMPSGVYYARLQNMTVQQVRPMLKVR
ncbi:MAG: T9SS type A sorting domain-containing protein, partial [Sediminibacterium sp.]|nr:T9SS type A sorting domain-containing protein [Sediminibacterium sp.]